MKRILFVINSLGGGGAERLVQTLSRELVRRGFSVEIITLERAKTAYSFPPEVKISTMLTQFLNHGPLKILALPLVALELRIRLFFIQPDGWMSLLYRANFAAVLTRFFGWRKRVVVSDHTDLFGCYDAPDLQGRVIRKLVATLYPFATVVAVSKGVAASLSRIGLAEARVRTIYNGTDLKALRAQCSSVGSGRFFVTVGRLSLEKDHPTLIQAFKAVHTRCPDTKLIVVGDGPAKPALEELLLSLNLSDDVVLSGWREHPYSLLGGAIAFVLSSRFEGFGLVLVEAMACGIPVISTDCPSGPAEILGDGEYGLLVPPGDPEALARTMLKVLEDEALQERLRQKGLERCRDFDVEKVCDQYLEILLSTD